MKSLLTLDLESTGFSLGQGQVREIWTAARETAKRLELFNLTLALAESLTGGWVSAAFTSIPGISNFYLAGVNAYSNAAKAELLSVPHKVLERSGAVSCECALAMASGIRLRTQAKIGLSTTGIAGPSGATETKSVGLTFISVTSGESGLTREYNLAGPRLDITFQATLSAIKLLDEFLKTHYPS
jgi:PncC family amidohydrolase